MKSGKHAERWQGEAHVNLHLVSSGTFSVCGAHDEETGILFHWRASLSLFVVGKYGKDVLCFFLC